MEQITTWLWFFIGIGALIDSVFAATHPFMAFWETNPVASWVFIQWGFGAVMAMKWAGLAVAWASLRGVASKNPRLALMVSWCFALAYLVVLFNNLVAW